VEIKGRKEVVVKMRISIEIESSLLRENIVSFIASI
jgi:hypothetical protein